MVRSILRWTSTNHNRPLSTAGYHIPTKSMVPLTAHSLRYIPYLWRVKPTCIQLTSPKRSSSHRLSRRPGPVPIDGAGLPVDRRSRGSPSGAGEGGTPAGCFGGSRWRRFECPGVVHRFPGGRAGEDVWCRTSGPQPRCARSARRDDHPRHPGVGPQHAFLRDEGRVEYVTASDDETIAAFQLLCRTEGIIPALESSHALAHAVRLAPTMSPEKVLIVNLSGRGDKDVDYVAEYLAG